MRLGYPTVSVLVLQFSPEEEQGANTAALQVCDVLGGIIGIAVAATLVNASGHAHLDAAMRIANPLLAVATLAGVALSRRAVRG
jgi:sugar phosphate permease